MRRGLPGPGRGCSHTGRLTRVACLSDAPTRNHTAATATPGSRRPWPPATRDRVLRVPKRSPFTMQGRRQTFSHRPRHPPGTTVEMVTRANVGYLFCCVARWPCGLPVACAEPSFGTVFVVVHDLGCYGLVVACAFVRSSLPLFCCVHVCAGFCCFGTHSHPCVCYRVCHVAGCVPSVFTVSRCPVGMGVQSTGSTVEGSCLRAVCVHRYWHAAKVRETAGSAPLRDSAVAVLLPIHGQSRGWATPQDSFAQGPLQQQLVQQNGVARCVTEQVPHCWKFHWTQALEFRTPVSSHVAARLPCVPRECSALRLRCLAVQGHAVMGVHKAGSWPRGGPCCGPPVAPLPMVCRARGEVHGPRGPEACIVNALALRRHRQPRSAMGRRRSVTDAFRRSEIVQLVTGTPRVASAPVAPPAMIGARVPLLGCRARTQCCAANLGLCAWAGLPGCRSPNPAGEPRPTLVVVFSRYPRVGGEAGAPGRGQNKQRGCAGRHPGGRGREIQGRTPKMTVGQIRTHRSGEVSEWARQVGGPGEVFDHISEWETRSRSLGFAGRRLGQVPHRTQCQEASP